VPQIEVVFDIDANGIVNVSAVDKATGKKQDIRITSGSGLSEEEIQKMVREAEEHREEDKQRREVVDTRNQLDGLILSSERMITEAGEKISANTKTELQNAIAEAKTKLASENLEELKAANEALQTVSHKIATEMYQAGGAPGAEGFNAGGAGPEAQGQASGAQGKNDDDVVDADFKEV